MKKSVFIIIAVLLALFLVGCAGEEIEPPAPLPTIEPPPPTPSPTPEPTLINGMVEDLEIELVFPFGVRNGTYSGELKDGLPVGYGIFTSVNDEGNAWTYTGEWADGIFEGEGTSVFDFGQVDTGIYVGGYLFEGTRTLENGDILYVLEFENCEGVDRVIYELEEYYADSDAQEFEFRRGEARNITEKLVAKIEYEEPYTREDFPALVLAFVDTVYDIANEYSVLVNNIDIILNQNGREVLKYWSVNSQTEDNEKLKLGAFRDRENDMTLYDVDYHIMAHDEYVALGKERLSELLTITNISTSRPNSADGVNVSVSWRNNSDEEIKYITFDIDAYNAVDDTVRCEIRNDAYFSLEVTGPIRAGSSQTSTERNAWYNKDIVRANIRSIEIEYMDGTKESINAGEVGGEWIS